ncbi:hypothetical protein LCGC14_0527300, partial [marine sediment metagenome]
VYDAIITPSLTGKGCTLWEISGSVKSRSTRNGRKFGTQMFKFSEYPATSYEELCGFLWRLDREGFTVYGFPDWVAMCRGIATFVYNTLKREHSVLRKFTKTRPVIIGSDLTDLDKLYVQMLMALPEARIGEATARKILKEFETPFHFLVSELGQHVDIPARVFRNSMKVIGRNV